MVTFSLKKILFLSVTFWQGNQRLNLGLRKLAKELAQTPLSASQEPETGHYWTAAMEKCANCLNMFVRHFSRFQAQNQPILFKSRPHSLNVF